VRVLNTAGLTPLVQTVQLMQVWSRVVGPRVARHCWPIQLVMGDLTIGVEHPVWKQELHLRQEDILKRVALALGQGVVKHLVLRVTTRPKQPATPGTPDAAAQAFGKTAAAPLAGDTDVAEAVARAAAAQHARNRRSRAGGG
jgi:hypothetical protein